MTPADEGISGTSTKKRKAFNKMIEDAESGKFNLVITKEISRFARNTLDSIYYTRILRDIGIGVIFMNDNINTAEPDSELRLTIMSSIAQEESRKTSDRVKWGQRRQMERGVVFGNTMLGYTIKDGKLFVKSDEAKYVQNIFHKYLEEGKGLARIAKELEQEGILTSCKNKRWDATAVLRILKNEKYCGDLKQKKYYTPNYLTHAVKRNKGEEDFIVIENHHEPIISRDIFERTQKEIERRGGMIKAGEKYTNRYAFSGKLKCGKCGARFISRIRKSNDGLSSIKRWQCFNYFKYGNIYCDDKGETFGCNNLMIRNEILEKIFLLAMQSVFNNKEIVLSDCVKILDTAININRPESENAEIQKELQRLCNRKQELVELFLDKTITKADLQTMGEVIDQKTAVLREKLQEADKNMNLLTERSKHMSVLKEVLCKIVYSESFSESVAKEILHEIVIHGKNQFDIYFIGIDEKYSFAG